MVYLEKKNNNSLQREMKQSLQGQLPAKRNEQTKPFHRELTGMIVREFNNSTRETRKQGEKEKKMAKQKNLSTRFKKKVFGFDISVRDVEGMQILQR